MREMKQKALHATVALAIALVPMSTATVAFSQPNTSGPKIEVSTDQHNWAPQLDRPVFDHVDRIVPGDSQSTTIWLRNTANRPLNVTLSMRWAGARQPNDLGSFLSLGIENKNVSAESLRTNPLSVDAGRLAPGETTKMNVYASLAESAPNPTQREQLKVAFVVQMRDGSDTPPPSKEPPTSAPNNPPETGPKQPSDSDAKPQDGTTPSDRTPGLLPRTGAQVLGVLAVGLAVFAVGLVIVRFTRRR